MSTGHANASIHCIRFLLREGLTFCGHDESEDSSNQGNFLKLLIADHNKDVKAITLKNAPNNNKLISFAIQKDIVSATEIETSNAIIMELGDAFFSVLIDESVSLKVSIPINWLINPRTFM